MANAANQLQFVGREEETKAIIDAIRNGENVLLYGEAGTGKTALIYHIEGQLLDVEHFRFWLPQSFESIDQYVEAIIKQFMVQYPSVQYFELEKFLNKISYNELLKVFFDYLTEQQKKDKVVIYLDEFSISLGSHIYDNDKIESFLNTFINAAKQFSNISIVFVTRITFPIYLKYAGLAHIVADCRVIKLGSFRPDDAKLYVNNYSSLRENKRFINLMGYLVNELNVLSPWYLDLVLRDCEQIVQANIEIDATLVKEQLIPQTVKSLAGFGFSLTNQFKLIFTAVEFDFAHRLLRRMSCVDRLDFIEVTHLAHNYGLTNVLDSILARLIEVNCLVKKTKEIYCLPSEFHKSYWYINDVTEQDKLPINLIGNMQITAVEIRNVKCFEDLEIKLDESDKSQLILGTNANGKTTILQLIAIALSGAKYIHVPNAWQNVVREGCEAGEFCLDIVFEGEKIKLCFEVDEQDFITCTQGANKLKQIRSQFIMCGYGANRHIKLQEPNGEPVIEAAATLFDDNTHLKHIKVSENYSFVRSNFDNIKNLINSVLQKADLNNPTKLISFDEKNFYFESPTGQKLGLYSLSEGFKSTFAWLFDFVIRVVKHGGDLSYAKILTGVVLIDEIDLHLHPSWQRTILPSLEQTFPRIQFIVTTHSPFVAQSISGGQIARLEWQDDHVDVVYEDTSSELSYESMAQEVFGIKSPFSQRTAKDLDEYRHLQLAIRKGEDVDLESFKELVIDISSRGEELQEVMRNEIHSLQRRTGKDFGLWKN